jgi:uncharacterized membrane protein YsdA (DUF1294 family)
LLRKISIVWLIVAGVLSALLLGVDFFKVDFAQWLDPSTLEPLKLYCLLTIVMSAISFVQFGWDKRQAKVDGWRVPEKTLLGSALACGWPGALLGQNLFQHKTSKQPFGNILVAISIVHLCLPFAYCAARVAGFI